MLTLCVFCFEDTEIDCTWEEFKDACHFNPSNWSPWLKSEEERNPDNCNCDYNMNGWEGTCGRNLCPLIRPTEEVIK